MSHPLNPSVAACPVSADQPQPMSATDRMAYRMESAPPAQATAVADCRQTLWLTVYFDGTGNNRDIDVPTFEHSNVARLFRARLKDLPTAGRYSFYVPGIGTPFREIGDRGGKLAMAVAKGGEGRIQWAMEQVLAEINAAIARANNPVNKITMINIAVFGFSRGAATARAFARRIAGRCTAADGNTWLWDKAHPVRLYFMGLFDTVASVGIPSSAKKVTQTTGATADGHVGWASNLRIPKMVERCVHFCAAHEIRNSFPLDTVLENGRYPDNCFEAFYPGVHSNVGGGYRPGEGARNVNRFAMLSLIPLRAMYDEAVMAGVPLMSFASMSREIREDFFPTSPDDVKARAELATRFNHYMATAGTAGKGVGETVKAHMRLYFRWRILHVGRKLKAQESSQRDRDAQRLEDYDRQLRTEREQKQAVLRQRQQEFEAASRALWIAQGAANRGRGSAEERAALEEARRRRDDAEWAQIEQEATVNTMPSEAQALINALDKYDQQFMKDGAWVMSQDVSSLSPFRRILREAWEMPALDDELVIAMFDEYVTDSLAGFDTDLTRATEHRMLYLGGDVLLDYAAGPQSQDAVAVG